MEYLERLSIVRLAELAGRWCYLVTAALEFQHVPESPGPLHLASLIKWLDGWMSGLVDKRVDGKAVDSNWRDKSIGGCCV